MGKPVITGITVSVDIADKSYGNGTESFFNVQGKYPDPATLDDVLADGLDMYFAAFKSLLAGRYAAGVLSGSDFKTALDTAQRRLDKVKKFLQQDQSGVE